MTVVIKILIPSILTALLVLPTGFSKEIMKLGTIGKIYPITEKDIIEEIKEKLMEKKKSGELARFKEDYIKKLSNSARNIKGVKLPRATKYQAKELIPIFTLEKDIKDANGKVIFNKGTKVNPLKVKKLSKMLCFFDSDDKAQIRWVEKYCTSSPLDKWILVNGKYMELSIKKNRRVYFDQKAILTKRLGIKALPATMRQFGEKLYVEEHLIN